MMTIDKHHHIFKAEVKTKTGIDIVIGYYYAETKAEVEDFLHRNDIWFDSVSVVPIVDVVENDKVSGNYCRGFMKWFKSRK